MRHRTTGSRIVATARVVALLVAGSSCLSGCSGGASGDDAAPTERTTVVAGPSTPTASPADRYDTSYQLATPHISKDAIARHGAEAAAGTAAAVEVSTKYAFNQELMASGVGENQSAVRGIAKVMTPYAARDWNHAVDDYIAHGTAHDKTVGQVLAMALYAAWSFDHPNDISVAPKGPGAVNPKIKSVNTGLLSDGRLEVKVKSSAEVRLVVDKRPVRMKVNREQTFWMMKTADGWKIDGWVGGLKAAAKYTPDK